MSVEKLIVDHMETWTSALQTRSTAGRGSSGKIDLYGIKKLRELILELAVRGKLVPQDPNDEPASELLKRIAAEKAELVKQGKIKKQKPLPEISEEEKPFELPEGWEWVTLATVGEIVGGGTPKSDNPQFWAKNGIKWITPADLYGLKGKYITSGARDISPAGLSNSSARLMPKGSVLFSSRAPIGYVAIADAELSTNQGFKSCVPYIKESAEYIYYFLLASAKKIDAEASGTTFKEVSGAIVSKILLPLPPLSEQLKIVSRANELMSLCDQLEQQSLTSLDAHQQLVETLLGTLTDSQNAEELAENWTRISEHFDTLFTTEASVDALKQTILQLAVMGKLVPQDPNDEPASELLKRIAQEKAQLVKEGKIKKQKSLPPISDEEKPFELPEGWEWSYLSDIGILARGRSKHRPRNDPTLYADGTIPLVQTGDVARSNGCINTYSALYNQLGLSQSKLWNKGTLCITIAANIADSGILNFDACFPDSVVGFTPYENEIPVLYFHYFMMTIKSTLEKFAPSTAQKNINIDILSQLFFPCPPLEEFHRIVDKVQNLLSVCDVLRAYIQSAQQTQLHLADSLTDAAIN
ncbi:TPA: restriction endonuclease subunit S [Escherichia coli]|uniref:restriction endonuclease subunit S n=1 Tax=Escherichia coli TaxID=562 RepID=UPI00158D3BD3|nr:restriction endonuclease subunit S [Escherichia coli]EHX0375798.1 restriction endonuclease subunit S [Escherichia coli]EJD2799001.1 restriction endonuclease subunit S [Escherichia coli]MCL5487947.1 restriction endonuclease subunit S [Escherichia coli]MCL5628360.1 restriction endonuclease subunit S [Escherichia coli]HCO1348575.1 restriction endonuclease subunit S [Escherichia coli]